MRSWIIWISIIILSFLIFLFSMDSIAGVAWEKYGNANLALWFNRSDADLAMQLGNYFFTGKYYDVEKAEKSYKLALSVSPDILWGNYQLARVYFVKGRYNEALTAINQELEANPENLRSLYVRGLIFGTTGRLKRAEEDFRKFTEYAPHEWAGYNDLAWILSKEGKYTEASLVLESSFLKVKDGRENPWLQNALGVAYLNSKDYEKARLAFKEAQILAEKLTINDWAKAYPGNNSTSYADGLSAFREAIRLNIQNTAFVDNSI